MGTKSQTSFHYFHNSTTVNYTVFLFWNVMVILQSTCNQILFLSFQEIILSAFSKLYATIIIPLAVWIFLFQLYFMRMIFACWTGYLLSRVSWILNFRMISLHPIFHSKSNSQNQSLLLEIKGNNRFFQHIYVVRWHIFKYPTSLPPANQHATNICCVFCQK